MTQSEIDQMILHDEQARKFAKMVATYLPPHTCSFTSSEVATLKSMIRWGRVVVYAAIVTATTGAINVVIVLSRIIPS